MRRVWVPLALALVVVAGAYGPRSSSVSASSAPRAAPAKKKCKTVTKKVHGKKKRVKVCKGTKAPAKKPTETPTHTPTATPTNTPTPTPTAMPTQTGTQHDLYTVTEGSIGVFDIDHGFASVGTLSLPQTAGHGIRGVTASPATHTLYVSYGGDGGGYGNGSLLAYDLVTNQVKWTKSYAHGIDSMAITPDGKTIYMPDGELSGDGKWYVIDAATGNETGAVIDTGAGTGDNGPHNTIVSLDGQHVYLGDRNLASAGSNYFYVASTATNQIIQKVGPFQSGIRPFTINKAQTLVYTSVTGFLGFQVGDLTTGKVLYTVPITKPAGASCTNSGASDPSHGVSLSPDEKQLYIIDWTCNYVHVFDVSHVPASSPVQVADIPVHAFNPNQSPCTYDCLGDGWILHSSDGRHVFVGDSGDIIDTTTRSVVANLPALYQTRIFLEVDWQNGVPTFTTTRSGVGHKASSSANRSAGASGALVSSSYPPVWSGQNASTGAMAPMSAR